jgi:hypothetical protein
MGAVFLQKGELSCCKFQDEGGNEPNKFHEYRFVENYYDMCHAGVPKFQEKIAVTGGRKHISQGSATLLSAHMKDNPQQRLPSITRAANNMAKCFLLHYSLSTTTYILDPALRFLSLLLPANTLCMCRVDPSEATVCPSYVNRLASAHSNYCSTSVRMTDGVSVRSLQFNITTFHTREINHLSGGQSHSYFTITQQP